jgi:1-acyl-sn-glycerol-3-phosphate acyltransferase
MMGTLRLALALLIALVVTPPLMLWQVIAVRTGWLDPRPVPRLWHRMVTKLLGLRIHVRGELASQRPLLIASNHISWTDIIILGSLADVHFIAKSEVATWPIFGTFARLQRSVFVQREARRQSGAQVDEIATRISKGDPMVLFAEGTTGDGNVIMPFKSTLFGAATAALDGKADTPVTVQPVAIAYTRLQGLPMGRALRHHAAWVGQQSLVPHLVKLLRGCPLDVEVHFGEPVVFGPGQNRKQLARSIETEVRTMLAEALRNPA